MKNYYSILQISIIASRKDIKKAYHNALKKDTKNIKDIKKAYFILGNTENKKKYDNYLSNKLPLNQIILMPGKSIGVFDGLAKQFINYLNKPKFS